MLNKGATKLHNEEQVLEFKPLVNIYSGGVAINNFYYYYNNYYYTFRGHFPYHICKKRAQKSGRHFNLLVPFDKCITDRYLVRSQH